MTQKKIKILHLIGGLDVGGAETMLSKIVTTMDRSLFESRVAVMGSRGPIADKIEAAGIAVVPLGFERGTLPFSGIVAFRDLFAAYSPDVVQSWMYHAAVLSVLAGGGCHKVWNLRCSRMEHASYSRTLSATRRLAAFLSGRPDAVIANSYSGKNDHASDGFKPKRWEVIPNGFDLAAFKPDRNLRSGMRRNWGVGDDDFLIVLPARADPMKDHETFTRAAHLFLSSGGRARFVLCGQGTQSGSGLDGILKQLPADSLLRLGERHDMPHVLAACDAMTLTSAFGEGFPNALGEAMASALVCIATDVGDCRRILGDAGIVVPSRSPEALSAAWRDAVAWSPEQRAQMGQRARLKIENEYSLPVIVKRYESLYLELVSGGR